MLRMNNLFLKYNRIFLFFVIFFICFPQILFSYTTDLHPVTITAYVGMEDPNAGGGGNNPGGGGSSGGGGGIGLDPNINLPTIVNFSGMAYPLSKVYILKDGNIAVTTIADPAANFSVSFSGLNTNTYTFSVYGEDSSGRKSSFFSFPIYITLGTTVNIGNIFLSPTIDIDKSEVKKGDNLVIFGQSIPKKEIVISVHSDQELFYKSTSNNMGGYLYNLDTSVLEIGKHQTKSKSILNESQISQYTTPLNFIVGTENKLKDKVECSLLRGDLNCDNHVNLIDFSIMAYWYKKQNPPPKIDLSSDGKISLVDFSIMAFNWTG